MRWLSLMLSTIALLLLFQDVGLEAAVSASSSLPTSVDPTAMSHWAFHKPMRPSLPVSTRTNWGRNEIDAFVLEQWDARGFTPPAEADRATLIRRVALDVIGLPPTGEEVERFLADSSSNAYEAMVDRYLSSARFGERWARVWLDLARYADSKGYGSDGLRPYMWRYRDWVINAFNRNLPYDQFTIEQLAGDLLPNPTLEQRLATAFHRNSMANDEGGTDDEEFRVAAVKDRVDTTMQVWMGLTFGCAKCHSHKYDPFTQSDYYSLFAFFNQTADADLEDDSPRLPSPTPAETEQIERLFRELEPLRKKRDRFDPAYTPERLKWEAQIKQADRSWVAMRPDVALALGGTDLVSDAQGTLEAQGERTVTNRYRLEFKSLPAPIRSLRLEVLPVDLDGRSALGRGPDGRLTLSEVQFQVQPQQPRLPQARFVRIDLPGRNRALSLAEVEVIGDGMNLALKAKASQSSTEGTSNAELALDAILNGNLDRDSVTRTRSSSDPWWEADLGRVATIERLAIWNRTDPDFTEQLQNYRVTLLDSNRVTVWSQPFAQAPAPVQKVDFSSTRILAVREASVSQADDGSLAQALFDRDLQTAWSISQDLGQPQEAVFSFMQPLELGADEKLVVVMEHSRRDRASLARFGWSGSSDAAASVAVPVFVRESLSVLPDRRSEQQHQKLGSFYWRFTPQYAAMDAQVRPLEDRLWQLQNGMLKTPVMQELPSDRQRATHFLVKGDFLNRGEPVSPRVPVVFGPLPRGASANRLGLARWLVDAENPLTARVAVNRLWAALFARGLVLTQEDFGTQGSPPTHPQLLDWLATEYVGIGWDTKAMLRIMLVSSTYRSSSKVSAELQEKDPKNEWLARFPRVRLEGEVIRDQALAVGGLLSAKMFGPSVFPRQPDHLWQPAFDAGEAWVQSSGEDAHRRSLYTFWRRSVPYPSLMAFNAPTREVCMMRRPVSNTPLQALVTLNDPVFVEAAQGFARRIVLEGGANSGDRARWAWRQATARAPRDREIEIVIRLYEQSVSGFNNAERSARDLALGKDGLGSGQGSVAELAAWTVVANMLLNLDLVLSKG